MRDDHEVYCLAEALDRRLRAIATAVRRPVETEMARGHLTGPQRSVMQALVRADGLSLKQLSSQVGLAHSTVSGIVDRLEQRGLVQRETDAADRRVTRVLPSERVRAYLRETLPGLRLSPLLQALQRATPEERMAIAEGVAALCRLLGSEPARG
jgi:MarR family transcriptional regulator, organic hydroperoxide resistance regulator